MKDKRERVQKIKMNRAAQGKVCSAAAVEKNVL